MFYEDSCETCRHNEFHYATAKLYDMIYKWQECDECGFEWDHSYEVSD